MLAGEGGGEVHHFYYSHLRTWVWLLLLVPFGLYSLVAAYALQFVIGKLALVGMAPTALGCGYGTWRLIRRLRERGPVVTFDRFGIVDRRQGPQVISWAAIKQLYIGPYGSSTSLLIAFVSDAACEQALGRRLFLGGASIKLQNAIIAPGAVWGVQLGPLRCRASAVLALAKRLQAEAAQAAARRQPMRDGDGLDDAREPKRR